MDKESVSRSRLFREAFLPGAFVRLRNHAYAQVVGVNSQSGTVLEQIDKEGEPAEFGKNRTLRFSGHP